MPRLEKLRPRRAATMDRLESRMLRSVVHVSSGNTQQLHDAIDHSSPGDTIQFAPGNYDLTQIPLLSNRTYVGSGALLKGGLANADNVNHIDVSGFTLQGAGWQVSDSSNINFHDNTIDNGGDSIVLSNVSTVQITNNTFRNDSGTAIGVPGPTSLDHVNVDSNNFDYCFEAIHLVWNNGGQSSVSRNVIQHATRHGIELQGDPQGLLVDSNWIDNWLPHPDSQNGNDSHMGISCATGVEDPGASNLVYATGVRVTNNFIGGSGINLDGAPGGFYDFSAIEIMGNGSVVSGNRISNWGYGVLIGWIGDQGLRFSANTLMNVRQPVAVEDQGAPPAVDAANVTASPVSESEPAAPAAGASGASSIGSAPSSSQPLPTSSPAPASSASPAPTTTAEEPSPKVVAIPPLNGPVPVAPSTISAVSAPSAPTTSSQSISASTATKGGKPSQRKVTKTSSESFWPGS